MDMAVIVGALRDPRGLGAALVVLVLILYGISVGRTRALVSLLAIYVAYTLAVLFPFVSELAGRFPEHLRAYTLPLVFLAGYLVVFSILSSSVRRGRLTLGELALWHVVAISLVQIGLLASIALALTEEAAARSIAGVLYDPLAGTYARWAWPAASLAILPFMRTSHSEE